VSRIESSVDVQQLGGRASSPPCASGINVYRHGETGWKPVVPVRISHGSCLERPPLTDHLLLAIPFTIFQSILEKKGDYPNALYGTGFRIPTCEQSQRRRRRRHPRRFISYVASAWSRRALIARWWHA